MFGWKGEIWYDMVASLKWRYLNAKRFVHLCSDDVNIELKIQNEVTLTRFTVGICSCTISHDKEAELAIRKGRNLIYTTDDC